MVTSILEGCIIHQIKGLFEGNQVLLLYLQENEYSLHKLELSLDAAILLFSISLYLGSYEQIW